MRSGQIARARAHEHEKIREPIYCPHQRRLRKKTDGDGDRNDGGENCLQTRNFQRIRPCTTLHVGCLSKTGLRPIPYNVKLHFTKSYTSAHTHTRTHATPHETRKTHNSNNNNALRLLQRLTRALRARSCIRSTRIWRGGEREALG